MTSIAATPVRQVSSASLDTVQGQAAVAVMKKAMQAQASSAAQLLNALPPPPALATTGGVGTTVNTYA